MNPVILILILSISACVLGVICLYFWRRYLLTLPPLQKAIGVKVAHESNPYPPHTGTLRINDPLRDNNAGYYWMDDSKDKNRKTKGCHFCEDAYHIDTPQSYCLALKTNFSDFVYEIDTKLLSGDEIGVVFRQTPGYRYYYFYIRRDGTYGLNLHSGGYSQVLTHGSSDAINTLLAVPNLLAIVANGDTIDLYVNREHLTQVKDTVYPAGRIGIAVGKGSNRRVDTAFSNLRLWTLD